MKKFFSLLEDNICAIILLVMMLLTRVNVVARYVLKASMPFVEELTCLGLIILSLTGAAVAAKRGAHLGLTVLTDFFPAKGQKFCTLLGRLDGDCFWCPHPLVWLPHGQAGVRFGSAYLRYAMA